MYIGYIYKITNKINSKAYIGKTINLERRWKQHISGNGGTSILTKALSKYGASNFIFEKIAQIECSTTNELNKMLSKLEIHYIKVFNTFKKGYNATIGGDGSCGYKLSKEAKLKLSNANKGKKRTSEKYREGYKKVANTLKGVTRDKVVIMKAAMKRRKPILQYSLDGTFLAEYKGATFINNFSEANIIACCKGKINSAYGFIWRYKIGNNYPTKINPANNYHISNKKVAQYSINGYLINKFDSITKAAKSTSISRTAIGNCLTGRSKTAGNYIWKYLTEKEVCYA